MKTVNTGIFIFLFALTAHAETANSNSSGNNATTLGQFSESLRELSSKVSPSVVQVVVTGFGFKNNDENPGVSVLSKERNVGSGVILSEDGYIVTNAHVVEGAKNIRIGTAAEESSTTTTRISRIARPSSIEIIFEAWDPIKCRIRRMRRTPVTPPEEHLPVLSAGLGMAELRETIASEDGLALEASMAEVTVEATGKGEQL